MDDAMITIQAERIHIKEKELAFKEMLDDQEVVYENSN